MIIGIIGNTTKKSIGKVIKTIVDKIIDAGLDYFVCEELKYLREVNKQNIPPEKFLPIFDLCHKSTLLFSVGGDGTMLATAHTAMEYHLPILGINFGKLGFLAEVEINALDSVITDLKEGRYSIEKRMILSGMINNNPESVLYAVNDLVIDKAGWSKMIELQIEVNGQYVTTISADGLIVSTPTGSTGYSLSTGGPVIVPTADVILLSPISPHSLTMRPLVLPSSADILVQVKHHPTTVHLNSDGHRVLEYKTPLAVRIRRSGEPMQLIRTSNVNYFEILRSKLLWGLDLRTNNSTSGKR